GVGRVVILMDHVARKKDGTEDFKLLPECTLPLTGVGVVDLIITDLGVMEVGDDGLKLIELAPGVTVEEIQSKTKARLDVSAVGERAWPRRVRGAAIPQPLSPMAGAVFICIEALFIMVSSVHADRIDLLRRAMAGRKVDACIVLSSDPHLSEYLPDHWQARAWLSGFEGSAG